MAGTLREVMPKILDAHRCAIMERFEENKGTLDGHPAVIQGRLLDFPSVATLDGSSISVQYAWETLDLLTKPNQFHLRSN